MRANWYDAPHSLKPNRALFQQRIVWLRPTTFRCVQSEATNRTALSFAAPGDMGGVDLPKAAGMVIRSSIPDAPEGGHERNFGAVCRRRKIRGMVDSYHATV